MGDDGADADEDGGDLMAIAEDDEKTDTVDMDRPCMGCEGCDGAVDDGDDGREVALGLRDIDA